MNSNDNSIKSEKIINIPINNSSLKINNEINNNQKIQKDKVNLNNDDNDKYNKNNNNNEIKLNEF